MSGNSDTEQLAFRCPIPIADSVRRQMKLTKKSKTDVAIAKMYGGIDNVDIIDRNDLPNSPGFYVVYTLDHKLLYFGRADNLRKRWASHHKFQEFMEASRECRIGFFAFDSADEMEPIIEEFKSEPAETVTKQLVTQDKLEAIFAELTTRIDSLEQRYNEVFGRVVAAGVAAVAAVKPKKIKIEKREPSRGLQQWEFTQEQSQEGIYPSDLYKKLAFRARVDVEAAAKSFGLEADAYLEEISGWKLQGTGRKTKFYPPSEPIQSPNLPDLT